MSLLFSKKKKNMGAAESKFRTFRVGKHDDITLCVRPGVRVAPVCIKLAEHGIQVDAVSYKNIGIDRPQDNGESIIWVKNTPEAQALIEQSDKLYRLGLDLKLYEARGKKMIPLQKNATSIDMKNVCETLQARGVKVHACSNMTIPGPKYIYI